MFDIGFLELAMIGVVALLVIGPERLPLVARKLGIMVGKARRFINHVQSDFKQEVDKAEELKRLLEEQAKVKSYHEIIEKGGEDEHGRVPVDRLPHAPKSFDDANSAAHDKQPAEHESDDSESHNAKVGSQAIASTVKPKLDAIKVSEDHEQAK